MHKCLSIFNIHMNAFAIFKILYLNIPLFVIFLFVFASISIAKDERLLIMPVNNKIASLMY